MLLVLVGGALAMSEIAVVAARVSRLRQRADAGDDGARRAIELSQAPGRFLATVQIGITLVGILAGAFGGATLAVHVARAAAAVPILAPWSDVIGVGVIVAGISFLTLVFGELVPKRIALGRPELVASLVAPTMDRLSRLAHPLVTLLNASSTLVLRLLRQPLSAEESVTDEEIQILLRQGAEMGVFEPIEEQIVAQLFRLSDESVGALVTPRSAIVWLDPSTGHDDIIATVRNTQHASYPVARGDLDDVIGVVSARALFEQWLDDERLDLQAVMVEPLFVPESLPALAMLERFREKRTTFAMVIDEFGGLEGLITIQDVMSGLVGELREDDDHDPDVVQRADGSWLVDGQLALSELEHLIGVRDLHEQHAGRYHSVGGLVMAALGRIPNTGDIFDVPGHRLEVVDMDGHRVDKVLVVPLAAS